MQNYKVSRIGAVSGKAISFFLIRTSSGNYNIFGDNKISSPLTLPHVINVLSFHCEIYCQSFVSPSWLHPFWPSEFWLYPVIKTITAINFAPIKRILVPEYGKFFLVESSILGFWIRNSTQGTRNSSSNDKDRKSVSSIQNPQLAIQYSRLTWIPLQQIGAINWSTLEDTFRPSTFTRW